MNRRFTYPFTSQTSRGPANPFSGTKPRRARVIVAGAVEEALRGRLSAFVEILNCPTETTAREALEARSADVLIIDGRDESMALGLLRLARERDPSPACVVVRDASALDDAVKFMRAGCDDLWTAAINGVVLLDRLAEMVERGRARRLEAIRRARQIRALRNQCRRQIRETTPATGSDARQLALAAELRALVRQELDLEGLLRTVLEFTLRRTGPTNAVILLPGSSGDFGLGAYANYDLPKDSAEMMLDGVACVLGPAFAEIERPIFLASPAQLKATLHERAEMFDGSTLCAFSCRQDDECLAVVALFRDASAPLSTAIAPTLEVIRELFGEQLARVLRTHNRHLPKHKWMHPGEERDADDQDLAA